MKVGNEVRAPRFEAHSAGSRVAAIALFLLFLANAMNFMDRVLFGILQESVKKDLLLTDFQLGLLGGPAFAILYSLTALPIGRLADRISRVRVIVAVLALWSLMTGLCGIASSFVQLAFARVGVSVGEAGIAPASHSILSDFYPLERRAGAISKFTSGTSIGTLSAGFLGGALAHAYGWRAAFIICGSLGIVLSVIISLCIHEPTRGGALETQLPLRAVFRLMGSKRSFRHLCAGMALGTLSGFSVIQYLTSFFIRAHHLPLSTAAKITGIMIGGVGFCVTIGVGVIVDRAGRRSPRLVTLIPAVGLAIGCIAYEAVFAATALWAALCALLIAVVGAYSFIGAGFTAAQDLAPPRMRSTTSGLLMLIVGIVGYSVGSPLVGFISDTVAVQDLHGTGLSLQQCAALVSDSRCASAELHGLRRGLMVVALPFLWASLHFWWASKTFVAERAGAK